MELFTILSTVSSISLVYNMSPHLSSSLNPGLARVLTCPPEVVTCPAAETVLTTRGTCLISWWVWMGSQLDHPQTQTHLLYPSCLALSNFLLHPFLVSHSPTWTPLTPPTTTTSHASLLAQHQLTLCWKVWVSCLPPHPQCQASRQSWSRVPPPSPSTTVWWTPGGTVPSTVPSAWTCPSSCPNTTSRHSLS